MSLFDKELIYWIAISAFLMPLILAGVLLWFVLAYQKKRHQSETTAKDALLREQALIIQSQTAIEAERNRIASDMHDDIGSGLTRIKFLSDKASSHAKNEEEGKEIQKIASYSNDLVRNMGEIIWAMNSRFDNSENLIAYVRRYASEYLEEHNIDLGFEDKSLDRDLVITGEKRRNLFLVIKEILHNVVKYSGASKLVIQFQNEDHHLKIVIWEIGGKGFDAEKSRDRGNGLYNMARRMESIGGRFSIQKENNGMVYKLGV